MRSRILITMVLVVLTLLVIPTDFSRATTVTTTVGTTTNSFAIGNSEGYNQGGFLAAGRLWTYYTNGTYELLVSSTDGLTWAPPIIIRQASNQFQGTFDGTYFYYAQPTVKKKLGEVVYRRGLPNSDGTITWSAPEQVAVTCGNIYPYYCDDASIAVDSAGYVWIGYSTPYSDCSGCLPSYPYVTKNANDDGTWSTAAGFPLKLSDVGSGGDPYDAGDWGETVVSLTNQKVYVLYGHGSEGGAGGTPILGRLWDPVNGWGPVESATTSFLEGNMRYSSAVAIGDDIYLVYIADQTTNIQFVKRTATSGAWSSEITAYSLSGTSTYRIAIALSVDSLGNLFLFWMSNPTANHIYYEEFTASTGTWDTGPTDWISESAIADSRNIFVYPHQYEGMIGVTYETGNASPYAIKFAILGPALPNTEPLTTNVASGSGSIAPDCSSGCSESVGVLVSLTATASSGWTFSSWSITGASCSGGSATNPCTFTMPNAAVSVSATFAVTQTLISVTATTSSTSTTSTFSTVTGSTTLSATTNSALVTGTTSTTSTVTGPTAGTTTTTFTSILSTSTTTSPTTSSVGQTTTATGVTTLVTDTSTSTTSTGTTFTTTTSAGTVTVTETDTFNVLLTTIFQELHQLADEFLQLIGFQPVATPIGQQVHRVVVTATTTTTPSTVTMTVTYSVVGGGSPTAPVFYYVLGGVAKSLTLTKTAKAVKVDAGSAWFVSPNPLGGSGLSQRWYSTQSLSGTASTTTIVFAFQHQYYLTMKVSSSTAGSVTPSSGWQNAGVTITVKATAKTGHTFKSWTGSGTGSYTGTSATHTITMNSAITETATFT